VAGRGQWPQTPICADIRNGVTMDSDSRNELLADVEAFCQEVRPVEDLCYLEHRFNDQAIGLARKHGILGLNVPVVYGGRGADLRTYVDALARIGREGTGVRTLFSGHCSIGQTVLIEWGNEAQKRRVLPETAAGHAIMAFGLTEPEAGSNPREMQMTYRREGDRFVLNGVKYLISNGSIAHLIVVFAYPEPTGDPAADKARRFSAFLVETDQEGIEREMMTAKVGLPTSDTSMFELTDYPVPVENLLGAEGQGLSIAMQTLRAGRLSVAAGCLGVIEDCLEEACRYAKERSQHGKQIARHQLVQEHIATIELARQASESLIHTAANAKQAANDRPDDAALVARADLLVAEAKLFASDAACRAADSAMQVFGGRGYSELFRPGRHWKDVRVCRIYEGTDEILKLKIAAGVLGKEYEAYR
jgi:alkylation response protein AidB-like acyl-CoA dehydrogenase